MNDIDRLKADLAAAREALSLLEKEKYEAIEKVRAEFRPKISEANSAIFDADKRLKEAISAATLDHEWEGKKVQRTVNKGTKYHPKNLTEYGVVFTYRHGVDSGKNYPPQIGAVMVRLVKKDGTPGKKTEYLNNGGWELADA